ncbi:Uma2 family endonuclease [Gloeobacter kilaueensis]|uniref:Putative restriction endonuclease domain-containing protein n=1 Tax=Gloeobacter kilaueensis (strain ATCC BAA-2537 / CCAP 1431/1 / ULC 316 / JS1) TaxID=1183438 RepID=U5QM62_GLOK1|nr:Uma2 family endonuclease [Gloeobacter kilaueensis]AGY58699.1 hypothetical protein GKIL_2453 [Gloeobacter kilaueensis JS1]
MSPLLESPAQTPIRFKLQPVLRLNDDQLFDLCQLNRDLRIERSAEGELLIMSPTGSEAGARNSSLTGQLWFWNRTLGLGRTFDSSAGFVLPDGAMRSPDAAWIRRERWDALSAEQRQKFAPLPPDFVAELRSPSDLIADLKAKMQAYIDNGVTLGWLIDPQTRQVWIYRPNLPPELLQSPLSLSDPLLPGFVLDLGDIFTE